MPDLNALFVFSLIALGMVMTPGPNMLYLISTSMSQGRMAGLVSLGGVALGFATYLMLVAFGVSEILFSIPHAFDIIRIAGAMYLFWLGLKLFLSKGSKTLGQATQERRDSKMQLFSRGYITNLLNPKIALMYLSLLPQFVDPKRGALLLQVLALGSTQIGISVTVNALIALMAGSASTYLLSKPTWMRTQRMFTGGALMLLGLHLFWMSEFTLLK